MTTPYKTKQNKNNNNEHKLSHKKGGEIFIYGCVNLIAS